MQGGAQTNEFSLTAVDYEEEVLCCGSGVGNTEEEPAMQILANKMNSAKGGCASIQV